MMKSIVATVSLISQNGPNTCVTYFNFTDTQQSNTYYGLANNDGTITQLADLGPREDPQGRITVGKDYFTFTVLGGKGTGWGCCDELTTLTTYVYICSLIPTQLLLTRINFSFFFFASLLIDVHRYHLYCHLLYCYLLYCHLLYRHLLYRHHLYRHLIIPKPTRPSLDLRSPSAGTKQMALSI